MDDVGLDWATKRQAEIVRKNAINRPPYKRKEWQDLMELLGIEKPKPKRRLYGHSR